MFNAKNCFHQLTTNFHQKERTSPLPPVNLLNLGNDQKGCGCCPVHVVEVPVEVHHLCPQQQHHHQQQHILLDTAPTPLLISNGSSYKSLLPSNQQQQQQQPSDPSSHKRCTITPTRSMPSDLCKAAQQQQKTHYHKMNAQNQHLISRAHRRQQVQSVRLNHCGDFAVMKRADWAQLNLQAPSCHHHQPITTHPPRHRCSLVVPVACECREMEEEEEEDEREEGEEEPKQHKQEEGGSQEKQSEPGDQFSVVRQNLLGPLSFDDLYYM
uniref:Uncharacterized protein n=1 Tax=Globodera rostochiensis TaxID=31243 RepID=A0A914IB97_GLORO